MTMPLHGMARTFDVLLERDEDGWFVASVPAMPGCHTQGKTKAEALRNVREAMELWLADGDEPRDGVRIVGVEHVTLEA